MRKASLPSSQGLSKRKLQAQQTRTRILQCALSLFREKGFDRVSIDEITSSAGVSKGSFYTYFQTKSDIIIEEFRLIDDYYEKKEAQIFKLPTAASRLKEFTRLQLRYIERKMGYPTLSILYINQLSTFYDKKILTDRSRPLARIVSKIIAEGQSVGEIREGDPLILAEYMNRSMTRILSRLGDFAGENRYLRRRDEIFCDFVLQSLLVPQQRVFLGDSHGSL